MRWVKKFLRLISLSCCLRVSHQFQWLVEGFTARTHWDEVPKVVLALETKSDLPPDCAKVMDALLQDINPEYRSKRNQ